MSRGIDAVDNRPLPNVGRRLESRRVVSQTGLSDKSQLLQDRVIGF